MILCPVLRINIDIDIVSASKMTRNLFIDNNNRPERAKRAKGKILTLQILLNNPNPSPSGMSVIKERGNLKLKALNQNCPVLFLPVAS